MYDNTTEAGAISTIELPSPPASDTYINPQDVLRLSDSSSSASRTSLSPDVDGDSAASPQTSENNNNNTDASQQSKKKRKTWGQVLPEPTTNLPPRKRAKTDAEKEQRKYERVQRNRQAAHNSRMRKQQEMETLSEKNKALEAQCKQQEQEIARLQQALQLYRGETGVAPLSPASTTSAWVSPPSLCDPGSPSVSSTSFDQAPTPPPSIKLEPSFSELKPFNDSHSAEMCSQQWTSNLASEQKFGPISLMA